MKHGKKHVEASSKIEAGKLYEVNDALALTIETATAKFDETIECHIRLGVDPRSADQQVRGSVVLPNGTGKTKKVLVIAKGDKADAAKAAGADIVGAEEIVEKIAKIKLPDLNTTSLESAMSRVKGTARSMGVTVEE